MRVGILLYPKCSLWSASSSLEMLRRANIIQNHFHGTKSGKESFHVEYISALKESSGSILGIFGPVSDTIFKHKEYDLVIVPGFDSDTEYILKNSVEIVKWLAKLHDKGVVIAGFCTGCSILAKSGILKQRTATTHWLFKDLFEAKFPDTPLDISKTIIDYGDVIMSGSATSYQNLLLMLIEKVMGRTIAVYVSKAYLIDMNRARPDSYMDLMYEKQHHDREISKAQSFIKAHFDKMLSLDEIATNVAMNKRTFVRRFKNATNDTPLNYIHKLKVEKAKYILENDNKTFEEISFMLGYEDVSAFRKVFVKHTGVAPMDYRMRYQVV